MVGCSILGCKSCSERQICGITFHSFPANSEIRLKWVEATGRQNWHPTKYSKMCSIHFEVDSFHYKKKNELIKPNVVPIKYVNIQPSTSTRQEHVLISESKSTTNVLQEVQNIKIKRQCLESNKYEDIHAQIPPVQHQTSNTRKEKHLKEKLEKEKKNRLIDSKNYLHYERAKDDYKKKTALLENIIAVLKSKMLVTSEDIDLLSNIGTENADFLKRYLFKENCPRKYSASLRKFAISLHFISPKAYLFVRKQFDTCLPHPKTLYKWYTCIDCEPGFTREAFDALKLLVSKSTEKILCCVSLDEMCAGRRLD